ncbi:MAG: transketolase C-terminal domain-containing protein [Candidatus Nezhaarchaeales archaeon]
MPLLFIDGNSAAAYGAKLCRPGVVCAYPITPQTPVVERLAEFIANGELDSIYIPAEGEHSAMAIVAAAAATGVRTFTATSSQGLSYMQECLFLAAGYRLPVVMAVANRSMGPPWTILAGHDDSVCQRDTGWIQAYCSRPQEILDMVIQAYRIAEDRRVLLPIMVCYEGFATSHLYEVVDVPDQGDVDSFLPPYEPPFKLDVEDPLIISTFVEADWWLGFKKLHDEAMERAKSVIAEVDAEFAKRFGRSYGGLLSTYRCDDARVVVLTMGNLGLTARVAVDRLRERGVKVGLVRLRFLRPFPREALVEALEDVGSVCVLERNCSPGGYGGAVFHELRSALYAAGAKPLVLDFIVGMGGRDVTVAEIEGMAMEAARALERGVAEREVTWVYGRRRA